MSRKIELNDTEISFLVSLLKSNAAFHASRFESQQAVKAEVLIGKLEGRYK